MSVLQLWKVYTGQTIIYGYHYILRSVDVRGM